MASVESLKLHPENPKLHPGEQLRLYAKIIRGNGWRRAVVVSKRSGFVVKGNGAVLACRAHGIGQVPIEIQSYASEREELRDLNADNALATLGENDETKLAELLESLGDTDHELAGILKGLEDEPEADSDGAECIDHAKELQTKWKTKLGQLWVMGNHRLLCGDSTNPDHVKRLCAKERAHLMNTDPPYGIDYAEIKNGIPRSGFRNIKEARGDIQNDDLTDGAKLQAFLETCIRTALPFLTEKPAFYFWHPMLTQGTFFAAAAAADILIHRQIIWKKPHMVLTRSGQYHWQHELCFYGWIRGKPCAWFGDKSQTSVWELGEPQGGRLHPTQKPVELFAIPMRNHTREGDYCYEPFSGSGSQILAGEQLNRRVLAMELDPRYVAVALERWTQLTDQKPRLEK